MANTAGPEGMTGARIAELVMALVAFLPLTVGFVFLILRRRYFPLRQRSFPLITVKAVCALLFTGGYVLRSLGLLPCNFWNWFIFFNYIWYGLGEILTAYRTYFKWRLSQYSSAVPMLKEEQKLESTNWYIQKRHVLTDSFFFAVIGAHVVVLMGAFFLSLELSASEMWSEFSFQYNDCSQHTFLFVFYGLLAIYYFSTIIVLIYIFRKNLKGAVDGLNFKRDLKCILLVWPACVVGYGIFAIGYPDSTGRAAFTLTGFALSFWLTTGRSILATYTEHSQLLDLPNAEEEQDEERMELNEVLKNPASRNNFLEYLQSEWSAENLLFWEDVEFYRQLEGRENLQREGMKIYDKYFADRALLQLNLSSTTTKKVRLAIDEAQREPEKWSSHLFEEAQKAMFHLMATDSFVRFKQKRKQIRMESRASTDLRRSSEMRRSIEIPTRT